MPRPQKMFFFRIKTFIVTVGMKDFYHIAHCSKTRRRKYVRTFNDVALAFWCQSKFKQHNF